MRVITREDGPSHARTNTFTRMISVEKKTHNEPIAQTLAGGG